MKPILALSLSPLGAGYAAGAPDGSKPMSGLLAFGSNSNTDDEVWRNAAREVLERIKFFNVDRVAITAVSDLSATARRLYDLSVAVRLVVKWAVPGAAQCVDIGNALECFTGSAHYANAAAAEHAAMQEAQRRLWLSADRHAMDEALALAVWCYAAAQQRPELSFNQPKRRRAA